MINYHNRHLGWCDCRYQLKYMSFSSFNQNAETPYYNVLNDFIWCGFDLAGQKYLVDYKLPLLF